MPRGVGSADAYLRKPGGDSGRKAPDFWVLPTKAVLSVMEVSGGWSKAKIRRIPNFEIYRNAWHLISNFVGLKPVTR